MIEEAPLRQDEPSIQDVNDILTPEAEPEIGLAADDEHEHENQDSEESSDESEEYVKSIVELADSLETDPSELYNLEIPMSDGMEPLSISSLKDFYVQHHRDSEALKSERAALESEKEKAKAFFEEQNQQYQQSNQQFAQMTPELQASVDTIRNLQSQYNMIDWAKAEDDDPGEAALMRQKFTDAMTEAQTRYSTISNQVQAFQHQQLEQFKAQQANVIMKEIPEWRDASVRNSEWSELSSLISSYGFSQKDLESVYDARIIKVMSDYARLKKKFDSASPENRQRNRSTGKTLSNGKLRLKPSKKNLRKKIIEKGAASNDQRDKAAAVSAILNM